MTHDTILVSKSDLTQVQRSSSEQLPPINDGQILVQVDLFGLSANNISYAAVGEMLGYWAYFPAQEGMGCIPVWGIATVVESHSGDVDVGEQLFGYFPMSSHLVLTPADVSELCFSDATEHRRGLHPWYNRYYKCANDPLFAEHRRGAQVVLWALFMTGWMMADELQGSVDGVVVSSASSKTAISLAWALKFLKADVQVVGLTSASNRDFVASLGSYDSIVTYDELTELDTAGKWAYVDIAGNAIVTSQVHVHLGDALADSVLIGGTHRVAADEPLPMPGPSPRFFFIPDVAEQRAGVVGHGVYHAAFTEAWLPFVDWASAWLDLDQHSGSDAVEESYHNLLAGGLPAQNAKVFTWQ